MSRCVRLFLIGGARQSQLDVVATALAIGPLCFWARRLTTHQPCVFGFAETDPIDRPGRARLASVCAMTASMWSAIQVQLAFFAKSSIMRRGDPSAFRRWEET